jgi:peptide/nickel transport system ATP-binding protein
VSDAILQMEQLRVAAQTEAGEARLIVDGVDLELRPGEVLGLIGESGAGKSTLGLAALAYTRPGCRIVGGRILFRGVDIQRLSEAGRRALRGRRIAYIAQSAAAAFNPAKKLFTQVCEGPMRHGLLGPHEARRLAVDLFGELDLPEPEAFGERYPHQVSGGQIQRAMVAMAMACRPDILVLDEPTTALDVTVQIEVLAAIRRVIRDHQTAGLYITHDLALVAQVAHRILVLRDGRTIEVGKTDQILGAPRDDYTRRLILSRAGAVKGSHTERSEEAQPLVAMERVSASYGKGVRVLREISLAVHRGETVAVVGESGSGKTTLARVICGLLSWDAGRVQFKGEALPRRLRERSRDLLRRIQMVYQVPEVALNPRQTVREIVGRPVSFYFGLPRDRVRTRVEELLGMVGLSPTFASRRPGELSGGQIQRVSIARALAAKPELVICDEVTSALDQLIAEEILRLLDRLQREMGVAYLVITHDLGTVRRMADRVAVMHAGALVDEGPLPKVLAPPCHPYTELLLSSVPEMRLGWLDDALRRRVQAGTTELDRPRPTGIAEKT